MADKKPQPVSFRRPYDGSRVRVWKEFSDPSLTKQAPKDECDINRIVNKFLRTGVVDHLANKQPRYLDCVNVTNYNDAIDIVRNAQSEFEALPAAVRRRFDNDPAAFLAAFDDPALRGELEELGLIEPAPVDDPPQADPPPAPAPRANPEPETE